MDEESRLMGEVVRLALTERVKLKRGENLTVETWSHGLPMAREFVHEARKMGAHPMLLVEDEDAFWRAVEGLKPGSNRAGSHEWAALKETDAYVFVIGPADLARVWKNGPKMGGAYPSNEDWYANAAKAKVRGVRMLWGYTADERAAALGLDQQAWRRMILEASAVKPAAVRGPGTKLMAVLKRGKVLRIGAPNGTELRMKLKGRNPQMDDGSVSPKDLKDGENMTGAPAGQVWVAPDEASVEGHFFADRPSYSFGKPVEGAEFEFKGGQIQTASFRKNGEVFDRNFSAAKGHKDRLGMLVFGLNPKVTPDFPQATMASGVVALSIGSNEELDGKNETSFMFLAPLATATVDVDKKRVVENGKLLL